MPFCLLNKGAQQMPTALGVLFNKMKASYVGCQLLVNFSWVLLPSLLRLNCTPDAWAICFLKSFCYKFVLLCLFYSVLLFTCRFRQQQVYRNRNWTRAVRPDEWSCKQSICKVETDQHPTRTNTQWSRMLHGFNSEWPSSVFSQSGTVKQLGCKHGALESPAVNEMTGA